MNLIKTLSIISIAAITLSACSNKQAKTKKYYRLSPTTEFATTQLKPITLVIKRPKALSILGGRPMVATKEDGSLVQLSHNFWLESPKVLLQDKLKNWASAQWLNVSYQLPAGETHQILDTRILAFEKRQTNAVVSLEFTLYDHDDKLLYNKQFNAQESIKGEGFMAFTKALSTALSSILNQLAAEI